MRKNPGFAAVAVVTLALGIGANTAVFSNVNALVLRPFSLPALDRVVAIWETVPKEDQSQVSAAPANFRDWMKGSKSFESLAAFRGWDANLTGDGLAERAEGYQVTPEFFSVLGVATQMGRPIGPVDFREGAAPVVVVGHGFWQRHLGSDPKIVGRDLLLSGRRATVIGVGGNDLDFPAGAEIWTPLDLSSADIMDRGDHDLHVVGRLKKGVSVASAQADLQSIASRLAQQFPNTNGGHAVRVVSLTEDVTNGTRQFVFLLMGAAAFVLLLACVNVANLQLARAASRRKEMAIRMGLGASQWQLVRQLLIEGILLACAAGGAGLILATWGMGMLRRGLPPFLVAHVPGLAHVEMDSQVVWFTLAISLGSGILAGLAPARRSSRSELSDVLKENTRSATAGHSAGRLRGLLVISEVALALVLLVGSGLMVTGFRNLLNMEMGFDRTHVLTLHVALPDERYRKADQVRNYYDRAIRQIQALPSVQSAACATSVPSGWSWDWTEYTAEGRPPAAPGELPSTISQVVSPDFFATLRVRLLKGRLISAEDGANAPLVAVISQSMAQKNWPDQNPIGRHVKLGRPDGPEPERTIVGVVGNVQIMPFDPTPSPTTYVPFAQMPRSSSAIVVRTSGNPTNLAAGVITQLRAIDPAVPAYDVRPLEQVFSDSLSGVNSSAQMMLIFAFVGLVLAAAGIFAVMAYSVSQRTHEIGVRMALGARRVDVLRLVVESALKMAAIGLAIGITLALFMAHAISSAVFGVIRVDPPVFIVLTAVLGIVAALAAYVPARHASKVDPMVALRYE
jgi:putative ABC transport system permease protein